MHAIRRRAKYAAWYDDPADEPGLLKNPFAKIKLNNLKSEATSRQALKLAGASINSNRTDHPKRSAVDLPPASGPQRESFDETNEHVNIESTSGKEHPLRHSLLRLVTKLFYLAGEFFQSTDASEKQSATFSVCALEIAESVFKKSVKPQAILLEMTFVQVT